MTACGIPKWEAAASSAHDVSDFLRFVPNPRFQEKISRQDALGTANANSLDP